jgi:hypothetical protein
VASLVEKIRERLPPNGERAGRHVGLLELTAGEKG